MFSPRHRRGPSNPGNHRLPTSHPDFRDSLREDDGIYSPQRGDDYGQPYVHGQTYGGEQLQPPYGDEPAQQPGVARVALPVSGFGHSSQPAFRASVGSVFEDGELDDDLPPRRSFRSRLFGGASATPMTRPVIGLMAVTALSAVAVVGWLSSRNPSPPDAANAAGVGGAAAVAGAASTVIPATAAPATPVAPVAPIAASLTPEQVAAAAAAALAAVQQQAASRPAAAPVPAPAAAPAVAPPPPAQPLPKPNAAKPAAPARPASAVVQRPVRQAPAPAPRPSSNTPVYSQASNPASSSATMAPAPVPVPASAGTSATVGSVVMATAKQLRISRITAQGVFLETGRLVRPGEKFDNGEVLRSSDPETATIITNARRYGVL